MRKGAAVDAVRVDVDWLRGYAKELDKRTDEAQAVLRGLTRRQLEPEAFGELGRSLGTPQAYQRAADKLHDQLEQAERVLAAAAKALREAADHYAGQDTDAADTLNKKGTRD
jgi:uncharacterized protein YukE